ncbi:MAG TPA: GNAT family N-acetyltransferase [Methylomirabilota bacterium]|nr:GNAT family N-acetyltransferase [Methylomirabilota bacterium]
MAFPIRPYEARDFQTLYRIDQACFPPGIAYTKTALRYFLAMNGAQCLVAEDGGKIAGFILAEENRPLAHIITLDVDEAHRRRGLGSRLLAQMEANLAAREVRSILLETATTNAAAIAFWQVHGYRSQAVLKRYYLGRLDAYEMRKTLPVRDAGKP